MGFGLEGDGLPTERRYWDDDDFDSQRIGGKTYTWLVSGCGDGALTDLLRLCIREFRHDEMLGEFTQDPRMRSIRSRIREIEQDAALQDDSTKLHDAYLGLQVPWVVKAMENRRRRDTTVALNAPAEFLTRAASPLNRFLVGQLLRAQMFELVRGKVEKARFKGSKVEVKLDDGTSRLFDRIIRRHGPESALSEHFPQIAQATRKDLVQRRDRPALTDQTRTPLWIENCFGPETRPVPDVEDRGAPFTAVVLGAEDTQRWRDQIEVDLAQAGGVVDALRAGTFTEWLDRIRRADVVVLVIAHRLGQGPAARDGDDDRTPWLGLALEAARGVVVTACVHDDATWNEKKENDDLLNADPIRLKRRVQALAALKASLPEPLRFGSGTTFDTPAELATAVMNAAVEQLSEKRQSRVAVEAVEALSQNAPAVRTASPRHHEPDERPRQHDFAIVIGIENYPRFRSLRGPGRDATEFHEWLCSIDGGGLVPEHAWLIRSTPDPPGPVQHDVDAVLLSLIERAARLGGGRRLYFYFSGYGATSLLPDEDIALLLAGWSYSLSRLALSRSRYAGGLSGLGIFEELVMFIDCCLSIPVLAVGMPSMITFQEGRGRHRTRMFLATTMESGRPASESWEAERWQGAFTRSLLRILRRAPAGIEAADLKNQLEALAAEGTQVRVVNGLLPQASFGRRGVLPRLRVTFRRSGVRVRLRDGSLGVVAEHETTSEPWVIALPAGLYQLEGDTLPTPQLIDHGQEDVTHVEL